MFEAAQIEAIAAAAAGHKPKLSEYAGQVLLNRKRERQSGSGGLITLAGTVSRLVRFA
jgi:hypothetical protein